MSYGPIQVFSSPVASGTSTAVFQLPKSYSRVFLELGSMSTAAALDVYASADGVTYRQVMERVKTAPVQYQSLVVATGTTQAMVPLVDVIYPYVQFRASATVGNGVSMALHCID